MKTTFGKVADLDVIDESTFTLDFSKGALPPEVTGLVRLGSLATYCDEDAMYTAPSHAPRMHFSHDTQQWGLLREVGSTNRNPYSGYSTQYWSGNPGGIATTTPNAIPFILDGRMAAHFGLGGGYVFPFKSTNAIAYPTTGYTCASVFVKPRVSTARPRMLLHNAAFGDNLVVVYDPTTDTVSGEAGNRPNTVIGMEKYPDGWRRIFVSGIATTNAASYAPLIWIGQGNLGDFYFYGMQVETIGSPYPTSFIPTTTGALSRTTESGLYANIPNSLLNRQAGTLIADFTFIAPSDTDVCGIVGLANAEVTANQGMFAGRYNEDSGRNGRPRVYVNHPDITNYLVTAIGNLAQGSANSVGFTYDFSAPGAVAIAHGVGASSYARRTNSATLNMDSLSRVMIGTLYGPNSRYLCAHFQKIRYIPRALTEAQLVMEVGR